jgi:hypothetical protein
MEGEMTEETRVEEVTETGSDATEIMIVTKSARGMRRAGRRIGGVGARKKGQRRLPVARPHPRPPLQRPPPPPCARLPTPSKRPTS